MSNFACEMFEWVLVHICYKKPFKGVMKRVVFEDCFQSKDTAVSSFIITWCITLQRRLFTRGYCVASQLPSVSKGILLIWEWPWTPVTTAVVVQYYMLAFIGHRRGPHMRPGSNRNQTLKPSDKHTRCPNSSAQKHSCSAITTMINKLKKNKLLAKSYKAFMCHYVELNVRLASLN